MEWKNIQDINPNLISEKSLYEAHSLSRKCTCYWISHILIIFIQIIMCSILLTHKFTPGLLSFVPPYFIIMFIFFMPQNCEESMEGHDDTLTQQELVNKLKRIFSTNNLNIELSDSESKTTLNITSIIDRSRRLCLENGDKDYAITFLLDYYFSDIESIYDFNEALNKLKKNNPDFLGIKYYCRIKGSPFYGNSSRFIVLGNNGCKKSCCYNFFLYIMFYILPFHLIYVILQINRKKEYFVKITKIISTRKDLRNVLEKHIPQLEHGESIFMATDKNIFSHYNKNNKKNSTQEEIDKMMVLKNKYKSSFYIIKDLDFKEETDNGDTKTPNLTDELLINNTEDIDNSIFSNLIKLNDVIKNNNVILEYKYF